MTALRRGAARTFDSLRVSNFRRFFLGQVVSQSGTWMQTVAEAWLVLKLTGSGVAVGLTPAFQFLPVLVGASWGGLLADRFPKRRILLVTQATSALPSFALWALIVTGRVEVWMIYGFVLIRGSILAIDNPTRQAFISEMVGTDRLANAVGLNSALTQSARVFGPALAGIIIATKGVAPCFLLNGVSFVAILVSLLSMRVSELHAGERHGGRGKGQLRAAARHVWDTPQLRIPLLLTAVVGTFAFNFRVTLPLMAKFAFHGGAGAYAALTTAMGIGAILGALGVAVRARSTLRLLSGASATFGGLILAVAMAPTLRVALVLIIPMGAASIVFASTANSSLQVAADPSMRGRVMALYAMMFVGSTPIGGPLVGWVSSWLGSRAGLAVGGIGALAVGLFALVRWCSVIEQVPEAIGQPEAAAAIDPALAVVPLSTTVAADPARSAAADASD